MKTDDVTRLIADAWIVELRQMHERHVHTGGIPESILVEHVKCISSELFDPEAIRKACVERLDQARDQHTFAILLLERELPSDDLN